MPDSMMGKRIDDFTIEERLGQGAMAVVYKAFQPSINRHVALKVIRLDEGQGQHEDFRLRFAREAKVIAGLEHIHILPIYSYNINEEMAYLAMRWLKGGSLSQLMRREKLTIDRAADIFIQIAKGLAYAHSKGVIHRDLKPSNIMLDDTGNAYLTDFGLAKMAEGSGEITKTGNIVGTPAYMSPEQLRGETLDHRSDIYSLGVILYNMMVGRLPFESSTTDLVSVIYQHLEKEPVPPSELNPNFPPAVEVVILRALQKNRSDRYGSALEMANALSSALGRSTISSDTFTEIPSAFFNTSANVMRKTQRFFSSSRVLAFIIGILIIVLLSMLVIQGNKSAEAAATQTAIAVAQEAANVALDATNTAASLPPTALPPAQVVAGEKWSADQIVPDDAQLALSRALMGANGFVAYIACSLDSEYHAGLARFLRDDMTAYGIPFEIYDSHGEQSEQIVLIEQARAKGAKGIILCPLESRDLLTSSLLSLQSSHIPLVQFADNIPSYGGVLIGGDNHVLGLEPGRFAGKIIRDEMDGKADVIILDYPDLAYLVARADGLEDGAKEFAPNINVVGRYLGGTPENGKASVEKLIQDGVKFNVILSINDSGAYGAIEAMQEAGWDCNSVFIASVDGEAQAQQFMRDDCFIRGSLRESRPEVARAMTDSMVQLLIGGTIAEAISISPGPMITKEVLEEQDATATVVALTPTTAP